MPTNAPTKRRQGRPSNASKWLTLDAVADILRCDAEVLARLLAKLPNTLPGAILDDDGWKVPERALRVILGAPCGPLPQMATVKDVAEAMRKSEKTIYAWLKLMKPGVKPVPLLPHKMVLGSIRIDARDVLALPAVMPGPRPSFFADKEAARVS
jgi:hypothetical protein